MRARWIVCLCLAACGSSKSSANPGHPSCPDGTVSELINEADGGVAWCIQPDGRHLGLELRYVRTSATDFALAASCAPVPVGRTIDLEVAGKQAEGYFGYWAFQGHAVADLEPQLAGKTCAGKPIERLYSEWKAKLPVELTRP